MAGGIGNKIEDLKGSFERLSPRERQMVGGLGVALVMAMVVLVGYYIMSELEEIEDNNIAMQAALKDIRENRACFLAQRQRLGQMELRMAGTPLSLNNFVEAAASAVGVSIAEADGVTPVTIDRYVQRGIEIKLRKISVEQLAKLIKEMEGSPQVVQVTRISVTTRWNQHKDLDVEMVVSTYEKQQEKPADPREKSRRRKRGKS